VIELNIISLEISALLKYLKPMEKFRYHEMLPYEIVARRRKYPVVFAGLGGLEWHGEHQAVGLDALKAEKLSELAAEKSGGFAMSTLWYGEPRTTGYSGGDHASIWETSYLWYLHPDCVDMSVYQGRKNETLIGVKMSGQKTKLKELQEGASVERGRKGVNLIVDGMVKKADQLYKKVRKKSRS